MKTITKTRIQMTIEVDGSHYGEDASIKFICQQAGSEAVSAINGILREKGVAVISKPKVLTVTTIEGEQ